MDEELSKSEKIDALRSTLMSAGWQKVIKPALEVAIAQTTNAVMANARSKEDEGLDDAALKQRVNALGWVLGWERKYQNLVDQLEQLETARTQTEPVDSGGSPY